MNQCEPSPEQVRKYLKLWISQGYMWQETSLGKLFTHTYPKNDDIDDVVIKVSSLNGIFGAGVLAIHTVAKHIVSLDIDQRLVNRDMTLVNDIAKVDVGDGKIINFYSFATKYCSHHHPDFYPIYDSIVEKMLMCYKKKDGFSKFKLTDLKHYPTFYKVMDEFRKFYGLEEFTPKEIDQYLWLKGRECFAKIKIKPKAKAKHN